MKISIICFTLTGQQTGEKLKKALEEQEHAVSLYTKSKYIPESIKESTKEWAGKQFESADGIIFIGATGIAVRSIAPYVASKKTDPGGPGDRRMREICDFPVIRTSWRC